jgi:hypothetical protein
VVYFVHDKGSDYFYLEFSDNDKCKLCNLLYKCPLLRSLENAEYCIPRQENLPTEKFCKAFEPNDKIKKLEMNLRKSKKGKAKER